MAIEHESLNVSRDRVMAGRPASNQQSGEPERNPQPDAYLNAMHAFANDPDGEPLGFDKGNDEDEDEPVDNLAAPVGIITAVIVGLLLWTVILLVIVWLK